MAFDQVSFRRHSVSYSILSLTYINIGLYGFRKHKMPILKPSVMMTALTFVT